MLGTESALGGTEVGVDVPMIYGAEYTLTLGPLHSPRCPVRLRRSLSRADVPHFGEGGMSLCSTVAPEQQAHGHLGCVHLCDGQRCGGHLPPCAPHSPRALECTNPPLLGDPALFRVH